MSQSKLLPCFSGFIFLAVVITESINFIKLLNVITAFIIWSHTDYSACNSHILVYMEPPCQEKAADLS